MFAEDKLLGSLKITGKRSLSCIVKIFLDIIFYAGIAVVLSLPFSVRWYLELLGHNDPSRGFIYVFLLVLLAATGSAALWIIHELRKIFKTVSAEDPFVMDNVVSLRKISFAGMLIAISYIVKIFVLNSFFTVIITCIFIIASLFALILSDVFKKAVDYKAENDLTI